VALVASVGIGFFVWSRGSGTPVTADTGGPRGPASVAGAKLDALSLASAEETFYTDHQKYLPIATTPGILALGAVVVHLSPSDSASITLDAAGVGYCISVTSRSATTSASSTVIYVSTAGGLQPNVVTSCPAAF
jgi:type IV pilus assembly protein PilA